MEIEDSNQNIIQVREKELSYFESFTKKNGIVWTNEDKNNLVLPLSKAYVGYIVTPERKINLKPKYKEIDFEHIFRIYLYVYAYKTTDSSTVLDISESNNDIDIGELFLESLAKNLRSGIVQTYNKRQSKTQTLKGQIAWTKTYKNYLLNHKKFVSTRISRLTLDNTLNQIIVTALQRIKHINKYSSSAINTLMYFENVRGNIKNGSKAVESITFNSNTSRYRRTLTFAAMIIDNLDYDDIGNNIGTESFIINFDRLFEDFVAKILEETPSERNFTTWSKNKIFADIIRNGIPVDNRNYLPDILYKFKDEDENFTYSPSSYAVLDVKNKAYSPFKNSDIYQILMYAKLLHSSKAILLYPSFGYREREKLILDSEIFSPSEIYGCFISISDKSGNDFIKSISNFSETVERTILDVKIIQ